MNEHEPQRRRMIMQLRERYLKQDFLRFMLASMAAQWVFALYTMVDGIFVAKGVSELALSAVNLASPYVNFLFSISLLFAVGVSTIAAMYMGQGKFNEANRAFSQILVVLAVISLVLTLAVMLWPDVLAVFLGAGENVQPLVEEYLLHVGPFSICFLMVYSFEVLVKTDGYPKLALFAVTFGCLLNCVLDYLFVFCFSMGVGGAAFATGLSQLVLIFIYLFHFLGRRATLHFVRFSFDWKIFLRSVKIGIPSGLTEWSAGLTTFLFNHAIMACLGEEAIISYTILAYVNTIVVMSMAGIAQGAQPMISYYLGAGRKNVCQRLLSYAIISGGIISALAIAAVFCGADQMVALFISPENTALYTESVRVLKVFSLSFLFSGVNIIAAGYFTSVEAAVSSFLISVGRGFFTLAAALVLMIFVWGGKGIWWSALLSEFLCLSLTLFLAHRYRKKTFS